MHYDISVTSYRRSEMSVERHVQSVVPEELLIPQRSRTEIHRHLNMTKTSSFNISICTHGLIRAHLHLHRPGTHMSENFLPGCGVLVITKFFIQTPLSNITNIFNIHHIKRHNTAGQEVFFYSRAELQMRRGQGQCPSDHRTLAGHPPSWSEAAGVSAEGPALDTRGRSDGPQPCSPAT